MSNTYVLMGNVLTFTYESNVVRMERKANSIVFRTVEAALKEQDFAKAYEAYKVNKLETGKFKITQSSITIKSTKVKLGKVFAEAALYAKEFGKADEDLLERFLINVSKNPNPQARDGLSDFLAHCKMPITDRGTFLAYRSCNNQFRDKYTGRMENMIGTNVVLDRADCDSNANQDCSRGLHVCHHEYGNFSHYMMVVEINPRDVVAVPAQYNALKMRVCRFRPLCMLDYFKEMLLIKEQHALAMVPVFMTEQTRSWRPETGVPPEFLGRYKPVDAWEWAKA